MTAYFLGIDIGTQGARVVILDSKGEIIASSERNFGLDEQSREEQSPKMWWEACKACLLQLSNNELYRDACSKIVAVAVTSTSGTVIPLDEANEPLHNAIMYSDKRSAPQGEKCTAIAVKNKVEGFTGFNSSSGLAKMVWFQETYPEKASKINKWIHAADYVTGILSGKWGITDYTNAFKSGYDVNKLEWPDYITTELFIAKERMPEVLPSGSIIGTILPEIAEAVQLPNHIQVITGVTDGCASQIASGAIKPGDWNTTIGTTMVIKGVTTIQILDEQGRIYSHRHPAGYWMPGGASNTGADWVTNEFGHALAYLSNAAAALIPTHHLSYPLRQKGERFPMLAPMATGFEPMGLSLEEKFTANMEGVAYLERYAFELIKQFTNEEINAVYTAGGGSNNEVWLKIRSNVLNLPIVKMKHVSGAVGAAILAASNTYFSSLIEAVEQLTCREKEVFPETELAAQYNKNYQQFIALLTSKGYIKEKQMLKVYLLRHGETTYNADGNRYCGRTDIDLTEKGYAQANLANTLLKDVHFDGVYSSPLKRAKITAAIASGSEVVTDDRLIEVDFGIWEGKTRAEFIAENELLWTNWSADPQIANAGGTGENGADIVERVNDFFKEIQLKHPNGTILVVAHNGINRLYMAYKLGMPLKNYRQLAQENSSITLFELDENDEFTLKKLNAIA